jgi:hypothetical protein
MTERPPRLGNGYVWICHTLMPSSKARLLGQRLGAVRHELRTRDYSEMGDPRLDTGVELWAHSDDEPRAASLVMSLLAEQ